MYTINVRNVCEALPAGVELLMSEGEREITRAGECLVAPGPVMTATERPCERVLLSAVRDANPFFHIAEALWMLAGRDDAAFLNTFIRNFGERFAESASGKENWETGGKIHGAYGRRWRKSFGFDQLNTVVEKLQANSEDRQCVIQMWDADRYHSNDLIGVWKDRPCNTHIYLRIHNSHLDFTVCCRSNDAVWGAHGANAVHFSVLQEYLAARIGVTVGTMYQLSNNYHIYIDELNRLGRRTSGTTPLPVALTDNRWHEFPQPLVHDADSFDLEVQDLLLNYNGKWEPTAFKNKFLSETAVPMFRAHRLCKIKRFDFALEAAEKIKSPDWQLASKEWIERRARDSGRNLREPSVS